MANAADTLVVLDSFIGRVDGEKEDRVFREGDLIHANDPAIKKWPHLFGQARFAGEPRVEQATRAPGERR